MTRCISPKVVKEFIIRTLVAVGSTESHAIALSEVLVAADLRGHFSHGLNRLEIYVNDLKSGIVEKAGQPVTIKESVATALVDGKNMLGPVVGNYCMNIAIEKSKKCGVGWVVARGSNHYGIAGYYAMQASLQGLVGYSFTNSTPCVQPTRAKSFIVGSNPVCCAAPGVNGDEFVLDMATSTVAFGKVEVNSRKGISIPCGWGADSNGKETNDPEKVLKGGGLLPLGGAEESGGYKGYGLSMMVEMMCGVMAGAPFGANIRHWGTTERIADLGQCFIAVNPDMFCDNFQGRMQEFMDMQRKLDPAEVGKPVLVAGDPEREHIRKCEKQEGIPYPISVVKHMNSLGQTLGVEPM